MKVTIQRAEAIFCVAKDLTDPGQRACFIQESCGGDDELCRAVEELLSLQAPADTFFLETGIALNEPIVSTSEPSKK